MLIKKFEDYTIEILDDRYYNPDSADNSHKYDIFYSRGIYKFTSLHAIRLYNISGELIKCVGVGCSGGGSGIHENSAALQNDKLFICCADSVFCLEVPSLNLLWVNQYDFATCFGVYNYKNDFIIHGEVEITKINDQGQILWKYSDRDILTSLDVGEIFRIEENKIYVQVWDIGERIIDAETGEVVNYS